MPRKTIQSVAAAFCAAALFLTVPACAKAKPPAPTVHKAQYSVRAEIVRLPQPGEPAPELQARHEEIPSFVEKYGEPPAGMRAMVMPFPIGPGLNVAPLTVGDKVMLTFEVDYSIDTGLVESWRAVAFTPLPDDAVLDFSRPSPPR
ncbi:MAG: copper-binding protein [Phycisphaerales bacterium]|nr:copper-binding protein [Phycisphaerales bacterium]